MYDSEHRVDINVRAPRYFIMRARGVCRECNASTELLGLALPPGHETLDMDEAAEDSSAADSWAFADSPAFIFRIEFLNAEAAARLETLSGAFRVDQQESAAAPAWTNHCEACGFPFDDDELFCEPGEPFFPISETVASAIRVLAIDEPFEASAGGYSMDPNFIYAMSQE